MKKKIIIGLSAVIISLTIWHVVMTDRSYTYSPSVQPETFDEFYAQKQKKSKELNVAPYNAEKLVKFAPRTPIAILYIHGYGASRAEGEMVVDRVSAILKANTYYLRLPRHGTNVEDHANATGKEHLDEIMSTLRMMRTLGDKVVVIATSMGGVAATYIAAKNPELIDALILSSPAYQFASFLPKTAAFYPVFKFFSTVIERSPTRPIPSDKDNWSLYFYPNKYMRALRQLYQLQTLTSNDSIFHGVKQPVMLQYYYKDEKNQDTAASVKDMKKAYRAFNDGKPNPLSRELQVETGDHVLLSKYAQITPDFDNITKETVSFINSLGWNK